MALPVTIKPTLSLAEEPTRLLELETTPFTPAVPLPQVTAPASVAVPLFQFVLVTT